MPLAVGPFHLRLEDNQEQWLQAVLFGRASGAVGRFPTPGRIFKVTSRWSIYTLHLLPKELKIKTHIDLQKKRGSFIWSKTMVQIKGGHTARPQE